MIAHLRGTLIAKQPDRAVIECGGVGYDVAISIPTFSGLPKLNAEVSLHIFTNVREDAIHLFGFLRMEEKLLFEKLISVSGIGPKLGITLLSGMAPEHIVTAIKGSDVAMLTRIPGIGKKTAERMCVELRDKLDAFTAATSTRTHTSAAEDAISALVNLGYQRQAAEKAVEDAAKTDEKATFDILFRYAMAKLRK